jgi:hypothetical protein
MDEPGVGERSGECAAWNIHKGLSRRVLQCACYRLDKWLNCLAVGVTPHGSAVHMTRVSYTSRASVRGLVGGHQSNQSILLGYPCLMSG